MQTAIDLAGLGVEVCLVEKEPCLGGHALFLHQVFPTLVNAEEVTGHLFQKVSDDPSIRVLSHAEVEAVAGFKDAFKVQVSKRARYVDAVKCTNCGECEKVCPVDVEKRLEMGLATRKAIYLPEPFAVPNRHVIDEKACLHFKDKSCNACQDICPEGAVAYDQEPLREELLVDAIVLATGFCEYDAREVGQYKYGLHPNVITGMEYERLCSPNGPTDGKILRIDNKEKPRSIVFVLCVGSRDERHLRYCCNIGCMNALKHAYYFKRQYGEEANAYICYTDIRAAAKRGEQFYQEVRASGVEFLHGEPSEVLEAPDGFLTLETYDLATSKLLSITADLVVLETGLRPQVDINKKLELTLDEDSFFMEKHPLLASNETAREGIFLAGALQQPMNVHDTLMSASTAAMKVLSFIKKRSTSH